MRQHFAVEVTPLAPPFEGDVVFFHFTKEKSLAVSPEDGERIQALFDGSPKNRSIVLSAAAGDKIRVELLQ